MKRHLTCTAFLVATVLLTADALAQSPAAGSAKDRLVLKIYNVSDLVTPIRQHPFRGVGLDGSGLDSGRLMPVGAKADGASRPVSGPGMMGGTGGMGGMGGGFFQVGPAEGSAGSGRFAPLRGRLFQPETAMLEQLNNLIVNKIAPNSWDVSDDAGTFASVEAVNQSLAIWQTEAVHRQVEELLSQLRAAGTKQRRLVRITAYWLPVLLDGENPVNPFLGLRIVPRELLRDPRFLGGWQGSIACLEGQTVHLLGGEIQNFVNTYIPVVGASEIAPHSSVAAVEPARSIPSRVDYLAQAAEPRPQSSRSAGAPRGQAAGDSSPAPSAGSFPAAAARGAGEIAPQARVGYQPDARLLHLGVFLQITPQSISADERSVLLDVQSIVTSGPKGRAVTSVGDHAPDQIRFGMQQIMTTVDAPLGKPIVVGGATSDNPSSPSLCLVIEASLSREEPAEEQPQTRMTAPRVVGIR